MGRTFTISTFGVRICGGLICLGPMGGSSTFLGASYDDETKWPAGFSLPYEEPIKRSEIDAVEYAETVDFLEESGLQVRLFYYAKFDFPTIVVNRADQGWFRYVVVEGREDWECGFELFHRDGFEYHSQDMRIVKGKNGSLLEAVREAPGVLAAGDVHHVQWVRRFQRDPFSRGYDILFRSLCGEQIQFEGDD